jgi:hypothetical protein
MRRLFTLQTVPLVPIMSAADEYKKTAGPREVEVLNLDWKDAKRDRAVPVKVFAQKSRPTSKNRDNRIHDLVLMSTMAFLDAYLRNDAAAKTWLLEGLAKELKSDGTFQHKPAN